MTEAAKLLGVNNHAIRRLIKDGTLAAEQVVPGAPYQIRATDLRSESVTTVLARKGHPCRANGENQLPMLTRTGCTMNASSPPAAWRARQDCC